MRDLGRGRSLGVVLAAAAQLSGCTAGAAGLLAAWLTKGLLADRGGADDAGDAGLAEAARVALAEISGLMVYPVTRG
jgi:hypothetical protein